ncbi:MAG TPA: PorV/PorQ family protein [bacterium]|nr:PorV/PorQ family protein [bacterium]HOL47138.1 PorV/PorQ family protein [bacterium]HPQ17927.1 PorV/PorQ family protein [bacterium]
MKLKIILLILIICVSVYGSSSKVGTTAANFLKLGYGARPAAMAEAYTGLADDIAAIYFNPAGLLNVNRHCISFMHLSWIEDINYEWLSYLINLSYNTKLAFTIAYLNYGSIQKVLENQTIVGSYSASDKLMIVTYSSLLGKIPFGMNFKIIKQDIDLESATGFAFDFGIKDKLTDSPFRYGLMVQNLGRMSKFKYERDSLPWTIRFGLMYPIFFMNLNTAFDLVYPNDDDLYTNIGLEYTLAFSNVKTFIRTGYSTLSRNNNDRKRYTVGFGVNIEDFNFDYAFQPFDLFDNSHKFSIAYEFGKPKLEKVKIDTFDITKDKIAAIKKIIQNGYTTRIVYYNPDAKSVTITGPFNNWDLTNYKLVKNKKGFWTINLDLPAGRYFYKLKVDDELINDPFNSEVIPDGLNGYNSILYISE